MKNLLEDKIKSKKVVVGIIGLGYVGLPLAIRFCEENISVVGFDIDKEKINKLKKSETYIKHITVDKINFALSSGFQPTSDFKKISEVDVVIVCVPTPLGVHNEPDLSYISNTIDAVKLHLKTHQLLVLESTTYPGTTDEEIIPTLQEAFEGSDIKLGENFYVGYSPEREDPGNKDYTTKNIPKIVSGYSKKCLSIIKLLYNTIIDEIVPVSSLKVAEMSKVLENIHRAVNIGLVNELKMVADKMDIDIYEVINAASTKPFGFTPYKPGPGLGGHCIPIDPFYLTWKAKEVGMNTRFIELAGEINTSMPNYVAEKVAEALNQKGKSIKNSKILILGLAYKKNLDDLRESPSLKLIEIFDKKGAIINYCDPFFKEIPVTRKKYPTLKGKPFNSNTLKSADVVLLSTDHDIFDYNLIEKESNLIVDTRGRFKKSSKIIRA